MRIGIKIKACFLLLSSAFFSGSSEAQSKYDSLLKMTVYTFVERPPVFPGGEEALARFLSKIDYPKVEKDADIQGKIYFSFVVDTTGSILDKRIGNKKESQYTNLEKVALAALDKMPKWKPGEQDGKKVAVRFIIPMFIGWQE
ncbi:energy transducer TonB [Chitinophaga sp. S165]|uniref:energy transducer TonB n=1 Tax=Chitinophaga sp. S165 TaxID=2135462 RepID=UPI000D9E619F|nr:energy transducer TonB [Chitinophaga sp. S165]PWV54044.1 TonB-like protein [Chitinophaga sp. S165]